MNKYVNLIIFVSIVALTFMLGATLTNHVTSNVTTVSDSRVKIPESNKPTLMPTLPTKQVERLNIPASQTLYLLGPIMGPQDKLINELKTKAKENTDLYLFIESPGGSVLDGAAVISAMEASSARVHTVCLSLCASMAFHIHQAGSTRLALDRSILMAHPASGGVQGTLEQMNSRLSTITRYVNKMDANAAGRAGIPFDTFKSMIVSELWLDAEDALAKHFLDSIVDVNTEGKPVVSFGDNQQNLQLKDKINLTW